MTGGLNKLKLSILSALNNFLGPDVKKYDRDEKVIPADGRLVGGTVGTKLVMANISSASYDR